MFYSYIILQSILIVSAIVLFMLSMERNLDFSCKGNNTYQKNINGENINITTSISVNFFSDKKIHTIVHGIIRNNQGAYTINREYDYSYRALDTKKGRYILTLNSIVKSTNDNDKDNVVSNFLFGGETTDINIKINKISNNVLIIGNVFSPIFSCTVTKN
ncbi:hypothetical protein CIFAM_22_00580 [Citrobacter farmeri GTC 1319]|nr:hypothetical protein CIFAM_22_00580 [Citrobacter farmeri GTC 1319]